MLELNREMARFSINELERSGANGCFIGGPFSYKDQSFLEIETVFSRICLISRLEISACPLVWG